VKPKLRIHFVDFWDKFQKDSNFLLTSVEVIYEVELDDQNPQIVFFSHFGNEHKKFEKSVLFFFSGEPLNIDFSKCDYALSWRFLKRRNHYRLPLFKMYFQDVQRWEQKYGQAKSPKQILSDWSEKKGLCCMVVSNPNCEVRNNVYRELSKYIPIDSGGRHLNNIGGPVQSKSDFIKNYKFVLSFENSTHPGYTTEKIFEPILEGCIPIYWGNILVDRDVNKDRFLNYKDFRNCEDLAAEILDIDANIDKALEILNSSVFPNNSNHYDMTKDPEYLSFLSNALKKGSKRSYEYRKILRLSRTPTKRIKQKVKMPLILLKKLIGFEKLFFSI